MRTFLRKSASLVLRRRTLVLALAAPLLLDACSQAELANVASSAIRSRDPKAAFNSLAQQKANTYARNPQQLLTDFQNMQAEFDRLFGNVKQESTRKWGNAAEVASAKRYVKYTEDYRNRVIVDYEKSTIRIEHIDEQGVQRKLHDAVVVALLTPDDPRSADVFTDREVTLNGRPFLESLVLDQNKQELRSRTDVERYADYLAENGVQTRWINVGGKATEVKFIEIDMIGAAEARLALRAPKPAPRPARKPGKSRKPVEVDLTPDLAADGRSDPNNYATADRIAPRYLDMVNKYAAKTGVDPALIMAIIYQESRFNPLAVSSAQAYGMMQLVPRSGGIEAFRKAKGENTMPTKEYLLDPESNIELGATYVSMLLFDHWMKEIGNMSAREYCAVSAYNTGPGNLAKAFTGTTGRLAEARDKANAMRPDELFDHLRANLPYAETRDYLLRVSSARKHYRAKFWPDSAAAVARR
jgi:membrane-bound lytic murein transglycosylase C